MKCAYGYFIAACIAAMLYLGGLEHGRYIERPLITHESVRPVKFADGSGGLEYSYSVDGIPCEKFVRDDEGLKAYKEELGEFARFGE